MKKLKIVAVLISASLLTSSFANDLESEKPARYSNNKINDALMCSSIAGILSNTPNEAVMKSFFSQARFFKNIYAEQRELVGEAGFSNGEFRIISMARRKHLDEQYDFGGRETLGIMFVSCVNWFLDIVDFYDNNKELSDRDTSRLLPSRKLDVSEEHGLTLDIAKKHVDIGFKAWDYKAHKRILDDIKNVINLRLKDFKK